MLDLYLNLRRLYLQHLLYLETLLLVLVLPPPRLLLVLVLLVVLLLPLAAFW